MLPPHWFDELVPDSDDVDKIAKGICEHELFKAAIKRGIDRRAPEDKVGAGNRQAIRASIFDNESP